MPQPRGALCRRWALARRTNLFPCLFFSVNSVYPEPRRVSSVLSVLILAVLLSSGCGGGASQPQISRTSSPQDFSLTLSTNALSVPQGGTSSPVNILVNGQKTVDIQDGKHAQGPFALQYGLGPKDAPGGPIKWRKVQIRAL